MSDVDRSESRARLFSLLDLALAASDRHRTSRNAADFDELRRCVATLLEEAFQEDVSIILGDPVALDMPRERAPSNRRKIAQRLIVLPTMMHEHDVWVLHGALVDLDNETGEIPPLLRPLPKAGKGQDPRAAEFAEQEMLKWIWLEAKASNRKLGIVKMEVAQAAGVTSEAVEKWKSAWQTRQGKEIVELIRKELLSDPNAVSGHRYANLSYMVSDWRDARSPDKAAPAPPSRYGKSSPRISKKKSAKQVE